MPNVNTESDKLRPVGPEIAIFNAGLPPTEPTVGNLVTIKPMSTDYVDDLYEGLGGAENAGVWCYMSKGPYETKEEFREMVEQNSKSKDPSYYMIILNKTGRAVGCVSFLRISPQNRTIELGYVLFSSQLRKTRAATEAIFLMARTAFEDLKYRRLQWRANSYNIPSRNAAIRLGFTFEGILRQNMITKGMNRDTAYYSIIDGEWETIKYAFENWLSDDNFDNTGAQKRSLNDIRQSARESCD